MNWARQAARRRRSGIRPRSRRPLILRPQAASPATQRTASGRGRRVPGPPPRCAPEAWRGGAGYVGVETGYLMLVVWTGIKSVSRSSFECRAGNLIMCCRQTQPDQRMHVKVPPRRLGGACESVTWGGQEACDRRSTEIVTHGSQGSIPAAKRFKPDDQRPWSGTEAASPTAGRAAAGDPL